MTWQAEGIRLPTISLCRVRNVVARFGPNGVITDYGMRRTIGDFLRSTQLKKIGGWAGDAKEMEWAT